MNGVIKGMNRQRGLFAAHTETGGYTVFEVLGFDDIEKGHIVSGPLDSNGLGVITNAATNTEIEVMIEAVDATKQFAQSLLA